MMKSMHHANVVEVHTAFVDGQVLWIVMPLMGAGSCAAILKKLFPKGMKDENLLASILLEVLKGLTYFHNDKRIHRDVKAGNILISTGGEVKLADFGVAGTLIDNGRTRNRQTFTGTPCWMAPEVMEQATGYDVKADIWSFGITAMELAFGRAPYANYQPMKVLLLTLKEDPPSIDVYNDNSYKFSKGFVSLLSKCLRKPPKKRPLATKLLQHRFFQKAKDQAYIAEKLVKKLPPIPTSGVPLTLKPEDLATDSKKRQDNKPVSVPSWIFDKDVIKAIKEGKMEEAEARAKKMAAESGKTGGQSIGGILAEKNKDEILSSSSSSSTFSSTT